MTLKEIVDRIAELDEFIKYLTSFIEEQEKGGPGSGCTGPNCGRPSTGGGGSGSNKPSGNDAKPTGGGDKPAAPAAPKPTSGVKPSALDPNRPQIEYTEEPRTRPRSGISPSRLKPKK